MLHCVALWEVDRSLDIGGINTPIVTIEVLDSESYRHAEEGIDDLRYSKGKIQLVLVML